MDAKEEIRARLPIEQLVAQYCQLKKKGRNYAALCPFHNDSKPSLNVSPDKGIAYCFACQSGGDVFSFYQKIESVDFPTAVKQLAEKVGVKIEATSHRAHSPTKDEKERLKECLSEAAKFYVEKRKTVSAAQAYVDSRGVPPALADTFSIGYAPDSFSETYDHLLKKGFSKSEIIASGLGIQKDLAEGRIYDRFRHRIMFPITDALGAIVGFGGRAMGESDAKYVNSPEGVLYKKSSILFGLSMAKDAIRKSRKIVLVEGYFDAVAAHKAGVSNVVAVSGTALTEEHVQILKRYTDEVILCLDQDSAGQLAAARAFKLLSAANLVISSVTLPAKDPDELVQREPKTFQKIVQTNAIPYIDAVIDRLKTRQDIKEPSGKRAMADILFPLLEALPSSTELRAYLEKAASAFSIVETELSADFRGFRTQTIKQAPEASKSEQSGFSRFELCIGLAFVYPAVRPLLSEMIPANDESMENIRRSLIDAHAEDTIDAILARATVDPVLGEKLKVLALYAEENFPSWSASLAAQEMRKLAAAANKDAMLKKQLELVTELKEARNKGRADEEAKLLNQYQQVLKLSKMASK